MKKPVYLYLAGATLLYLALPYFLFFAGWLRTPLALALVVLLVLAIWQALASVARTVEWREFTQEWLQKQSRWDWVVLVVGSIALIASTGAGGYGVQSGDWTKHNGILSDLVTYPPPVYYDFYGTPIGLVYYIAYYLPAAMVGKAFGIFWASQSLALWTLAGYLLAVVWLSLLAQRRLSWALIVLTLFSGISVIGYLTMRPLNDFFYTRPPQEYASWIDLQTYNWARNMQYSPHIVQMIWVPQHALPAWLATSLLVASALRERARGSVILVWSLTALWSVFATIGLLPFVIAGLLPRNQMRFVERLRAHFSWANLAGVLIMGVMLLFYATKLADLSALFEAPMRAGTILDEMERWNGPLAMALGYLYFCLVEFGIFFLIDRFHAFRTERQLWWTYLSVLGFLLVLPFFVYGSHNDLVMRASIPGIFFVALIVARNGFVMQGVGRVRQVVWASTLAIAFSASLLILVQQTWMNLTQGFIHFDEATETTPVNEQFIARFDLLDQYVSRVDTPFFQYLARALPSGEFSEAQSLLFGNSMVLLDHTLDHDQVNPGGTLTLMLRLRAIEAIAENLVVAVRLVDAQGKAIFDEQRWPENSPTSTWTNGRVVHHDQHIIPIPDDAAPGVYRLEMYLTVPDTWEKLPARVIATGDTVGEILPLAAIVVGEPTAAQADPAAEALFGDALALASYAVSQDDGANGGATLRFDLRWQALNALAEEYAASLQILGADGQVVAQQDRTVANGFLPASLWRTGLVVPDTFTLQIPAAVDPATLQPIIVVYVPETGMRLPVTVNGQPHGDALTLDRLAE